jgi:methylmalonyl-CoA/ethylmalonyl-CoA epimerase
MKLLQVALRGEDLDRAAAFYTALLGVGPAGRFGPLLFFRLGEVRLLIEQGASPALIYLFVDDLHDAMRRLPDAAEVVEHPRLIYTHSDDSLGPKGLEEWHAGLRDTEGNTVVLVAYTHP